MEHERRYSYTFHINCTNYAIIFHFIYLFLGIVYQHNTHYFIEIKKANYQSIEETTVLNRIFIFA